MSHAKATHRLTLTNSLLACKAKTLSLYAKFLEQLRTIWKRCGVAYIERDSLDVSFHVVWRGDYMETHRSHATVLFRSLRTSSWGTIVLSQILQDLLHPTQRPFVVIFKERFSSCTSSTCYKASGSLPLVLCHYKVEFTYPNLLGSITWILVTAKGNDLVCMILEVTLVAMLICGYPSMREYRIRVAYHKEN